jgi:hypothetical protein
MVDSQEASNMKDYIYSFGIIATFALGLWNIAKNYRSSQKTTFINTVTAERIKWMEKLRNNISEFCGLTYTWCMSDTEDEKRSSESFEKIDRLRHLIRLQLNYKDDNDRKIEQLILEIPELTHTIKREELKLKLNELIIESQKLLKSEWERVKNESRRGDLKENENALDIVFSSINDFVVEKILQKKTSETSIKNGDGSI